MEIVELSGRQINKRWDINHVQDKDDTEWSKTYDFKEKI